MTDLEEVAIESVEKEVKKIHRKFNRLTKEDKAGRTFVVIGVLLMSLGFIGLDFVFELGLKAHHNFLLGFLLTEILITGFAFMHKSLRGAWL